MVTKAKEKRMAQLGATQIDIATVCRDIRGMEDMVLKAIETDWQENRTLQFDDRIFPFTECADIAEWDDFLLERYPPLYANAEAVCSDCGLGPCNLRRGVGTCGLEFEPYQARLSLRAACRGALPVITFARELLNYAVKVFGKDKPITGGMNYELADTTHLRMFTALIVESLDDLNRALSYAEAQLAKCLMASYKGMSAAGLEKMTLHAGSMFLVATEVAELVKTDCFGFTNAADQDITEVPDYPPVTILGGLGNVEPGKPVITFTGDNFLPAWAAIEHMKGKNLTERIEICGLGAVGDSIARFYDRCRILGPATMTRKMLRYGISDVVVASSSCMPWDELLVEDAKKAGSRFIWVGSDRDIGLPDRTDDPKEKIIKDLIAGAPGAWIRTIEKAGEVAVEAAKGLKQKPVQTISEAEAKAEAKKYRPDQDVWSSVCPNSLPLSKALKNLPKEGLTAFAEVEKGCFFCGKCEAACPDNIRLLDIILGALAKRAPEDKLKMRAGRGPVPRVESCAWAFSSMWGNLPGQMMFMGCGGTKYQEDTGWIVDQLVSRNCIIYTGGCAAAEAGRRCDPNTGKYLFERFTSEPQPRNLLFQTECTSCGRIIDQPLTWPRTGAAISPYGNFSGIVDIGSLIMTFPLIIWGALPERMYTIAAAFARAGAAVIVGPESAFGWKRFCPGNKWDWQRWYLWDNWRRKKRVTEPAPGHLIIPVETKEEALVTAIRLYYRPVDIRDPRLIKTETYLEFNQECWGEWPDDWHFYARSGWELPLRYKSKMLGELRDKHGWEIERLDVKRARHPDGRMLDIETFGQEYSTQGGLYPTNLRSTFADPTIRQWKDSYEKGVIS